MLQIFLFVLVCLGIYFLFPDFIMARKKTLTPAERQRRCREKRKKYPEKVAEIRRKDLERYHARKKLVADLSVQEHRIK